MADMAAAGFDPTDGGLNVHVKNPTASEPANQRVNAQAGDFIAGSITDLATLLALAGASGDANTVASFMGRFTKIRDLLAATLTVQGTITEANSAAILTDMAELLTDTDNLATLAGVVSGGKASTDGAALQGPVNITTAGGATSGTSPQFTGTCTANADNSIVFASKVRTVQMHNQSAVNVPYEHDIAAVSTSPYLAPGALVYIDVHTTTIHVYPSNNLPINAASGLIVRGWN